MTVLAQLAADADTASDRATGLFGQRRRMDKHPEKTFIGRVECGFDFLGYHFSTAGLSVAK
jgi:hypothetical protein